jgi:uncharacterized protein (TIGR00369 family)
MSLPIPDEPVRGVNGDPTPLRMRGLEAALGWVRGTLPAPPMHHLTGIRPTDASLNRSTFAMPLTPWLLDNAGLVEPGVLAFLADAPLSSAIYTAVGPGQFVSTSELSLSFIQPVQRDATGLVARASVVHANRDAGVSVAEVTDSEGRLLAHATTRCVIIDVPPESLPTPPAEPPAAASDLPDPYLRPAQGTVYPPELWDGMSGLEFCRGVASGQIGNGAVHELFGARMIAADEGTTTWCLPSSRWLCAAGPALYGGVIAWLAQTAQDLSVLTTLPAGTVYATLDLTVHFLRPVMPGTGDLTATAQVVHRGRSIAVTQMRITNDAGKTVAVASGSSMIVPDGIRRMLRGDLPTPLMES